MKNLEPGSGYLKKIRKKILHLLKKSPGKFEDEDYHQLRVEIKKLKSVAGFLEFANEGFSKTKHLKPFSKIYKQAGKIRELQLEEAFLKKNDAQFIEHYLKEMDKKIQKEKKKFGLLITKKIRKKTKKAISKTAQVLRKTGEDDVIRFIKNERSKIASLIVQLPVNPANAHQLRKILKEDFYNRKRVDWPSENIEAENDLLLLLGKWHDCVVLNNQIGTSVSKAETDPDELAQLLKINAGVFAESENLFSQVNAALESGVF